MYSIISYCYTITINLFLHNYTLLLWCYVEIGFFLSNIGGGGGIQDNHFNVGRATV